MAFVSPLQEKPKSTHQLDPVRMIETADNLAVTIGRSFPQSALAGLAVELAGLARDTDQRVHHARRPILAIRFASVMAIGTSLVGLWYLLRHVHTRWEFGTVTELFEAADAGFNLLVIVAGALWFFVTLEARLKRKKALESMQELREFIHVIDMTQLYHTPELYNLESSNVAAPGKLDRTYLLFCAQMLAVISNLTALYTRGAAGDSIMRAAFDVEMIASAATNKLLSKAEMIHLPPASN